MPRNLGKLAVTLASLLLVGGCDRGGSRPAAPLNKGVTIHLAIPRMMSALDPVFSYTSEHQQILSSIFEPLYQFAYLADGPKIVPLLAADYPTVSKDRLTVTIPIRKGVLFQNDAAFKANGGKGREVTAADFIYQFKRLSLPTVRSPHSWIFAGRIVGLAQFMSKLERRPRDEVKRLFPNEVEGFQAPDPYTLVLKLTRPYPQLLQILTLTATAPVPHESVEQYSGYPDLWLEQPVGTGPFQLGAWERKQSMTLERNPTFHTEFYPTEGGTGTSGTGLLNDAGKQLPLVESVELKVLPDPNQSWSQFVKGEIDLTQNPLLETSAGAIDPQGNLSSELRAKGIALSTETGLELSGLAFNLKDPLLGKSKLLRQAISAAIDRERWIEVAAFGHAKPQLSWVPPGVPDRPDTTKAKPLYDLKLAKSRLRAAGYPDGKKLPELVLGINGTSERDHQVGEFLKKSLEAIGLKIQVQFEPTLLFIQKRKEGKFHLFEAAWALDIPDPSNAFSVLFPPSILNQDIGFTNKSLEKLYAKLSLAEPGKQRESLVRQLDAALLNEVPWVFGFHPIRRRFSQPWLMNYKGSELVANPLKYLRVDPEIRKRYHEK